MDGCFLTSQWYQEEEIDIKKTGGCWVATLGVCVFSVRYFALFIFWSVYGLIFIEGAKPDMFVYSIFIDRQIPRVLEG